MTDSRRMKHGMSYITLIVKQLSTDIKTSNLLSNVANEMSLSEQINVDGDRQTYDHRVLIRKDSLWLITMISKEIKDDNDSAFSLLNIQAIPYWFNY